MSIFLCESCSVRQKDVAAVGSWLGIRRNHDYRQYQVELGTAGAVTRASPSFRFHQSVVIQRTTGSRVQLLGHAIRDRNAMTPCNAGGHFVLHKTYQTKRST